MDSNPGVGVERLLEGGPPHDELEEDDARARLRNALFGVQSQPRTLGRFTLLERIGAGGFGAVYAAHDPQLDRKVALKLLRSGMSSGLSVEVIAAEAQALARLSHPNIVAVFDVVELPGHEARIAVAMELVPGRTLAQWQREQSRRRWQEVVAVYSQAARGLAAAHDAGLVHRDFKPSNVLLGDDGRVRVLDFGLSRALPSSHHFVDESAITGEPVRSTLRTHCAGTPPYMAPEQHRGEPADARSDVYSFCASLWEALHGDVPFHGEGWSELLAAKQRGAPTPAQQLPAHLRRLLMRGLAPEPSARHASMHEVYAELSKNPRAGLRWWWLGGTLTVVSMLAAHAYGGAREQPCSSAQAHLRAVWDADRRSAVSAAFAGSELTYARSSWTTVRNALDAWAQAWIRAHADACQAHASGEQTGPELDLRMMCLERARVEVAALTEVLASPNRGTIEKSVSAVMSLPEPGSCADVEALRRGPPAPNDPEVLAVLAAVRQVLARARAQRRAGHYDDALALAQEALQKSAIAPLRQLAAEAAFELGEAQDRLGHPELARATLRDAALAAREIGDDPLFAEASTALVWVEGDSLGHFDAARVWGEFAAAALARTGGDARLAADLHSARGALAFAQGRYEDAIAEHTMCLQLSQHAYGPQHYKTFACRINLGNVHHQRGDFELALADYREGIAVAEASLGAAHPLTLTARSNLVGLLERLGRVEEAAAEGEAVLLLQERALGPQHPDLAHTLSNLVSVHAARGDLTRAIAVGNRALALQETAYGPHSTRLTSALVNLALTHLELGALSEATALAQRALELTRPPGEPELADAAHPLVALGRIAFAQGDLRRAKQHLQEGRAIAASRLGPEHYLVGLADRYLAKIP